MDYADFGNLNGFRNFQDGLCKKIFNAIIICNTSLEWVETGLHFFFVANFTIDYINDFPKQLNISIGVLLLMKMI